MRKGPRHAYKEAVFEHEAVRPAYKDAVFEHDFAGCLGVKGLS